MKSVRRDIYINFSDMTHKRYNSLKIFLAFALMDHISKQVNDEILQSVLEKVRCLLND